MKQQEAAQSRDHRESLAKISETEVAVKDVHANVTTLAAGVHEQMFRLSEDFRAKLELSSAHLSKKQESMGSTLESQLQALQETLNKEIGQLEMALLGKMNSGNQHGEKQV